MSILTAIGQVVFYPLHFLFRLLIRILQLIVVVVAVLTPIAAAFALLSTPIHDLVNNEEIFGIPTKTLLMIIDIVGIALLIDYFKDKIRDSLSKIYSALSKIIKRGWFPTLNVRESLKHTREEFLDRNKDIGNVLKASLWILISLFLVGVFAALASEETGEKETDRLIAVEGKLSLVEASLTTQIETSQNHYTTLFNRMNDISLMVYDLGKLPPSGSQLVMYPLHFPPEADLRTKAGICPDKSQLAWLEQFKSALRECSRDKPKPSLVVTSSSSIAPIAKGGSFDETNELNCEVANQRAESVFGLLSSSDPISFDMCKSILDSDTFRGPGPILCTRLKPQFNVGESEGLSFDVSYRPWQSYPEMNTLRPVDNGVYPEKRLRKSEFFNRVVYIIVNKNPCMRSEWKARLQDLLRH